MSIIGVCGTKGGVGKSTTAFSLAVYFAQAGKDVLLIDTDVQKSSTNATAERQGAGRVPTITCMTIVHKGLPDEVRKLAPKYDHIIIDAGGRDSPAYRSTLTIIEKLIIPTEPAPLAAWTLGEDDKLVGLAQNINKNLRAYLLINKVDVNPQVKMADSVAKYAGGLLKNIEILKSRLCNRIAFRRCIGEGLAVNEMDDADPKAIAEMKALFDEVTK